MILWKISWKCICLGWGLNSEPLDCKATAVPLHHRVAVMNVLQISYIVDQDLRSLIFSQKRIQTPQMHWLDFSTIEACIIDKQLIIWLILNIFTIFLRNTNKWHFEHRKGWRNNLNMWLRLSVIPTPRIENLEMPKTLFQANSTFECV